MQLKAINSMVILGMIMSLAGIILITPYIAFDNSIDFVSSYMQGFLWSLVLLCAGLAIIHSYIDSQTAKAWLLSIIFSIIALATIYMNERLLLSQLIKEQQVTVAKQASALRSQIESTIRADIYLANTLTTKLRSVDFQFEQQLFDEYSNNILATSPRIRHIGLAEGLVVSHVYPLEGNEKAIGLDYRKTPSQLPMVQKAIDENEAILAGPVNLVQGGTALIARLPLARTVNPTKPDDFWGVMSLIIDTEEMFKELSPSISQLNVSIRGKDAMGAEGGIVYGTMETFQQRPISFSIALPYGEWQMAVLPIDGWAKQPPMSMTIRATAFCIWLMMIIFTLVKANQHKKTKASLDILQTKLDDSERRSNEQKAANTQKMQAQKLEAIGQLTGGIAHDFNNILAAITGYAELSQMSLNSGKNSDKLGDNLKEIIKAGNRAKVLVSQMLTFSRGKDVKAEVIKPISVLQETLQMMHSILPTSITLNTDYDDFDSKIKIDPTQLQQVLINLVVNARDAIPHSQGNITISCNLLNDYKNTCSSCNEEFHGNYLSIAILDDGQGIEEEKLTKIFDPFFTTKAVGKGTGMGLSVVHGILHGVNGHILLSSKLNRGTKIELLFPVTNEELTSNHQPSVESEKGITVSSTEKRVMIIDDEEAITQLYEDVFETEGMSAIVFNSPKLALDYYQQHENQIGVIVTDYTMPGLNGTDFIRAIRRLNTQVPVILCSGNADVLDRAIFDEIGVNHFLTKPVNLMQISKLVSSYL